MEAVETVDSNSKILNKSLTTNIAAASLTAAGILSSQPMVLSVGLFALSGAITNWLAIHMLFEKVPGLYGSGVIPARFEDFKKGIRHLVMEQFFSKENVERFYQSTATKGEGPHFYFDDIIEETDLSPSYEALVEAIMESPFAGMLSMIGGQEALVPLQKPFEEKMKIALTKVTHSGPFQEILHTKFTQSTRTDEMHEKVSVIVQGRLDELTPQIVKEIIQKMIREHLGWLVVWGGFFGGLIGLLAWVLKFH